MGIDLTTLLAGITGGAQGMGTAVQQDEARKRQLALDAMNMAAHQATMANLKAEAAHQQQDDYLKGVRQGVAPDGSAINGALNIASGMAGANLPGGASLTAPLAVAQARQENPDQYAPDRFQQLTAQSYLDTTKTPEAVAERARVTADKIKQASAAAELESRAGMLVGTRLPDGTIVDRPLARAMVANPQLASAYTRPAPVPKADTNQIVQGTGPDGQVHFYRVPKNGGPATEVEGTTPKVAAGPGGQNAPQMAAAKANLESARQIMNEYEDKLKRGEATIGVLGATEGALASSPTALTAKSPWDALMSLGANASAQHLQSSDPDLARYMTAKKYVAEAILNTHKRPNQTQYEIEQELSGAGPGATPQQIDMGRERRDRMYSEVFANPAAGAVASSHPTAPSSGDVNLGHPSRAQQLWDAAVAKHGRQAVEAKFGPRPAQ